MVVHVRNHHPIFCRIDWVKTSSHLSFFLIVNDKLYYIYTSINTKAK
ncbi:hypothetical protein LOK49_LG07G03613 [Camellia lanceoleosa]|uniref:Uncharacterized protein n=1 Tax=Camellia lanceoleosa TaxID=1840588 RepID=A0ACC0H5Q1_9ERIC|nr:hypothetical protein LOK49_LG07G03613 [Camellia lanceoleosa]